MACFLRPKCLVACLFILLLTACTLQAGPDGGKTSNDQKLDALNLDATLQAMSNQMANEPTLGTFMITDEETAIGDLVTENASLLIPAGAFEGQAEVAIEKHADPPLVAIQGVDLIGEVIHIKLISQSTRSIRPLQVSLAFNNAGITEIGEVLVGYFHQDYGWELITPSEVDLEQGILDFSTYHVSTFAPLKVNDQVRMQRFIQEQALHDFVTRQNFERACSNVEIMIESLLRDGLDVDDETLIEVIQEGMMAEVADGEIGNALRQNNYETLIRKTVERTARFISLQQTDGGSAIRSASSNYPSGHPLRESFRMAARAKRQSAQRILEDYAADHLRLTSDFYTTANRIAQMERFSRDIWHYQEMHTAYHAYVQGSENGRYGYNAAKGDFNSIVRDNPSSFDQVIDDYVSAFCIINNLDESRLDKATQENVRSDGLKGVLWLFEDRLAHTSEIDQVAADLQSEMEMYASRGLLQRTGEENPILINDAHAELETLMMQLMDTRDRIMHMLGRTEMVETQVWEAADADLRERMIPQETVIELVDQWFSQQLNLKPLAFSEINQALQTRLQQGSGWKADEVSVLVDDMIEKYP